MTDTPHPSWSRPPEVEAILAVGSLIVFSAALGVVIFQTIPAENEKYAMLMLGALIGVVKDTFGRYFQATKGGQDARRETAAVAKTLAETAAVNATTSPSAMATDTVEIKAETANVTTAEPAEPGPGELPPSERIK